MTRRARPRQQGYNIQVHRPVTTLPLPALMVLAVLGGPLGGCTVDHVLLEPIDLAHGAMTDGGLDGPSDGDGASDDLPPPHDFGFCPTAIDVYGDENVLLAGCGGPSASPAPITGGWFSPGTVSYDATLAGRLQSRLSADPDLVAAFGRNFRIRSCAAAGETLAALARPLPADQCGAPEAPSSMGQLASACSESPAPVMLVVASGEDDGCHGGGAYSARPNDKATFADHLAARLDDLLSTHRPQLALVGPRTEWYSDPGAPKPPPDGGVVTPEACQWKRADWDEPGLRQWQLAHPGDDRVYVFGHLHDEYQAHHPCCATLGLACGANWFTGSPRGGPTWLNCDGAQVLLDFWFTRLKKTLLANRFRCP